VTAGGRLPRQRFDTRSLARSRTSLAGLVETHVVPETGAALVTRFALRASLVVGRWR
jgi:hypothetical protein